MSGWLNEEKRIQSGNGYRETDEEDTVNHPPSERHHLVVLSTRRTSLKHCSISLSLEDAASSNTVTSLYLRCLTVLILHLPLLLCRTGLHVTFVVDMKFVFDEESKWLRMMMNSMRTIYYAQRSHRFSSVQVAGWTVCSLRWCRLKVQY